MSGAARRNTRPPLASATKFTGSTAFIKWLLSILHHRSVKARSLIPNAASSFNHVVQNAFVAWKALTPASGAIAATTQ
jgi:hypothetical protein